MNNYFTILVISLISLSLTNGKPQFWKMNTLSEKDLFILDVKSTMSAGLCYKQVQAKANDPGLRLRTISYCCTGYVRNPLFPHSVKCDPECSDDCSNGICSAPNNCECFPGYQLEGGRCESIY